MNVAIAMKIKAFFLRRNAEIWRIFSRRYFKEIRDTIIVVINCLFCSWIVRRCKHARQGWLFWSSPAFLKHVYWAMGCRWVAEFLFSNQYLIKVYFWLYNLKFKKKSLFFKYWKKDNLIFEMFQYCCERFGIEYWSRVTQHPKGHWNPVMLELRDYSPSIVSTGRLTHTSILIPPLFILRILLISGKHSEEMTRIEINSIL